MTVDHALLDWFRSGPGARSGPDVLDDDRALEAPQPSLAALAAASPDQQERLVGDYLCQEIGRVLHCPAETVADDQTMTDLGVGSMIGLELQNRIREALGVAPGLTTILGAENTRVLTRYLVGLLGAPKPGAYPA